MATSASLWPFAPSYGPVDDVKAEYDERYLTILPYGYECGLAIQCVPDIVRELAKQNIAVYQVIRYAKTKNVWT